MPVFAAVVDQEKPRAERDDHGEDMAKHRAFDAGVNPHMAAKAAVYGNSEEDLRAQKISKNNTMVQNEKGLWVKAPKSSQRQEQSKEEKGTVAGAKKKMKRNEFGEYVPIEDKKEQGDSKGKEYSSSRRDRSRSRSRDRRPYERQRTSNRYLKEETDRNSSYTKASSGEADKGASRYRDEGRSSRSSRHTDDRYGDSSYRSSRA